MSGTVLGTWEGKKDLKTLALWGILKPRGEGDREEQIYT